MHVVLYRNLNLGHAGSPNREQLEGALERAGALRVKSFQTNGTVLLEAEDPEALTRTYEYYDPIHTLPVEGQAWWAEHASLDESALRAAEMAEASRRTAALQAH